MKTKVEAFYDQETFTLTYIVYDKNSKDAIIIDPVLNYDPASSTVSTESINELMRFVKEKSLNVMFVLETHAHADHLTGAMELKRRIPRLKIAIGEKISEVQKVFKKIYNYSELETDGSQFDLLLTESTPLVAGTIEIKTIPTPGHTPACSSYLIEDKLFTGDALFMPDYGTGRCDFPDGSAEDLYHSVHEKLYDLPDNTRVFVGHDYQPNGRNMKFETSIGESKIKNIQLKESTEKNSYVEMRRKRDLTLSAPRLLLPSVQVNINAGLFPKEEENKVSYLKIPLRKKEQE